MPQTPLAPRKLPRQTRAHSTVETILEAATQVLTQGGLAAFNTNAVALRAGVSIGSLYQYFPSKDAVMAELIARQHQRQIASILALVDLPADLPLDERVQQWVRAVMQHHFDNALFASAIDHEEARLPVGDVLAKVMHAAGSQLHTLVTDLRTELPGLDPAAALRTIPQLLRAVVDAWANLTPPDLARAESEAVKALLGYLREAGAVQPASSASSS